MDNFHGEISQFYLNLLMARYLNLTYTIRDVVWEELSLSATLAMLIELALKVSYTTSQ